MKLQRQHFLLSYLKTLSVGPVGVSNSRPPASQPGAQPSELPVRDKTQLDSMLWFKLNFILGLTFFELVSIIFAVVPDYY